LSRSATNGVNQWLNNQIRLDSRVNYYYSPLALRRYSFVANSRIAILSASTKAVGSLHEEVTSPRKKSAGRRRTEPYSISVAEQLMSSFSAVRIPNNTSGSAVVQLTPALCM
ncbi:hypothetical protein T08_8782, partial [Trichinella sp. T8]